MYLLLAILRCSVLFWFSKISVIALLTNHLFLVFVVFSVPCLGRLCHFLSPVVFVVSLYLILFSLLASCVYIYIYIYSPSVSLVLCEFVSECNGCLFAHHSVLCSLWFWFIVCCSFSMKCLHIDPCFCLFSPASPQRYSF